MYYRKTTEHGNADALSRHPTTDETTDVTSEEIEVNLIACSSLDTLPITAKVIRDASLRDKLMSFVYRHVLGGWPLSMKKTDPLYPFFLRRDEISIVQNIVMWGIRVVVPESLQQKILEALHESHAGIVRMKSLARQYVWFPNIDKMIEEICNSCGNCVQNRANPPSSPLHPWEFPDRPWLRLHVDLAGPFLNKMWLIIADAHSKWPEVFDLHTTSTSTVIITRIRESICRFGIPEQIVSDNGAQFTSEEFRNFCKSNGIRHSTSSAYHPRSNGEANVLSKHLKRQ
jgi:hypothetical protein